MTTDENPATNPMRGIAVVITAGNQFHKLDKNCKNRGWSWAHLPMPGFLPPISEFGKANFGTKSW
jgi:hypothetical protein